jgi:hypothetical protein
MPPRVLSILCLIQFLIIGGAYLACSWGLKAAENMYSDDWYLETGWGKMVWLVKNFILLWLLIPVALAWVCARVSKSHRDIAWTGPDGSWLAVAVTLLVAWLFGVAFYSGLFPPEPRGPITLIDY